MTAQPIEQPQGDQAPRRQPARKARPAPAAAAPVKPVKPGSRRWKELVKQGILKDGERNWFLGDAALEIAPMGQTQANNGALDNLRRYAEETGVELNSVREYRRVAAAWPHNTRVSSTNWAVHRILAAHRDLLARGMTVSEARAAAGIKDTSRTGPESPAKDRASAAREYLADPDVAREVLADPQVADAIMADPQTATRIVQAQVRKGQERIRENAEREQPPQAQQASRSLSERSAQLNLGKACDDFTTAIAVNLPAAGTLADGERFWLSASRDRAGAALAALTQYLESGRTDLDEELARLTAPSEEDGGTDG